MAEESKLIEERRSPDFAKHILSFYIVDTNMKNHTGKVKHLIEFMLLR